MSGSAFRIVCGWLRTPAGYAARAWAGASDLLFGLPFLALDLTLGNLIAALVPGVGRTRFHPERFGDVRYVRVEGGLLDVFRAARYARAVTLGRWLVFNAGGEWSPALARHEVAGHALGQARLLGPFYVPLVLLDYAVTLQWLRGPAALLGRQGSVSRWSLIERWAEACAAKARLCGGAADVTLPREGREESI